MGKPFDCEHTCNYCVAQGCPERKNTSTGTTTNTIASNEENEFVPRWVLQEIYDTLRLHRNIMVEHSSESCLFRRTSKAMNWLKMILAKQQTDKNYEKISVEYITGKLLDFKN